MVWPEEMLLVLALERNSSCLDFKHPVKSKGLEELPGEDKVCLGSSHVTLIHQSIDYLILNQTYNKIPLKLMSKWSLTELPTSG